MKTLVTPPAAVRDEQSIQMLSAWIAERGMHCTLNIGFFDGQGHNERKAWGILVADVIRHIANAWEQERGAPTNETIATIVQSLNAELESPTSKATGTFSPGHS